MSVDLEDLHVRDGFYDVIGDLVPWLSGIFLTLIYLLSVCRCWRFVLDLVVAEASLTFAWCTWYLHGVWRWFFMVSGDVFSSWCVEMVFFMVCGDGCILRTYGVLGKGIVYAFIFYVMVYS